MRLDLDAIEAVAKKRTSATGEYWRQGARNYPDDAVINLANAANHFENALIDANDKLVAVIAAHRDALARIKTVAAFLRGSSTAFRQQGEHWTAGLCDEWAAVLEAAAISTTDAQSNDDHQKDQPE